jgi:O6-methylguanine-DNA--protein-cysteine methyltransferase
VIRETGAVDGYRWGTERKRAILAREWATAPAA